MKNSLFKRAVAAVSAVPLALTQCLTIANAVTVNDVAPSSSTAVSAADAKDVTLDVLLNIVPDESDGVKYEELTGSSTILTGETADELIAKYAEGREGAKVFTKASDWNLTAISYIKQAGKKTGTINIDKIKENLIKRGKNHKEVIATGLEFLSDAAYEIKDNGDIVITADVTQPAFKSVVDRTATSVLAKYGITGVDFSIRSG